MDSKSVATKTNRRSDDLFQLSDKEYKDRVERLAKLNKNHQDALIYFLKNNIRGGEERLKVDIPMEGKNVPIYLSYNQTDAPNRIFSLKHLGTVINDSIRELSRFYSVHGKQKKTNKGGSNSFSLPVTVNQELRNFVSVALQQINNQDLTNRMAPLVTEGVSSPSIIKSFIKLYVLLANLTDTAQKNQGKPLNQQNLGLFAADGLMSQTLANTMRTALAKSQANFAKELASNPNAVVGQPKLGANPMKRKLTAAQRKAGVSDVLTDALGNPIYAENSLYHVLDPNNLRYIDLSSIVAAGTTSAKDSLIEGLSSDTLEIVKASMSNYSRAVSAKRLELKKADDKVTGVPFKALANEASNNQTLSPLLKQTYLNDELAEYLKKVSDSVKQKRADEAQGK